MALPFLEQKSGDKGYAPVERVKELATRGFSEVDMIDVLRKEGYSADEIDSALTEALKMGVAGLTPPAEGEVSLPKAEDLQPQAAAVEVPETSLPQSYYAPVQYSAQQPVQQQYPSEEYIDYVVRERTADLDDKLKEFTIRYSELEKKMGEVHEQLEELSKTKTTGEELIMGKLEELKALTVDVETRLGGLEQAFKATLPALIESVRALSDVVQRMKREA
jgi:vacuolar-type H+-ATPase subunit I/STV1